MIPRQTLALALDAYRDLQSRKLFWVAIFLTGLASAVVAVPGFKNGEITLFGRAVMEFPMPIPPMFFYPALFMYFGLQVWLTWAVFILAILTTADFFPQLMREGAVDVILSRPIGRVRLFFTRYAMAQLFIAIQVSVFTLGCFLSVGLRSGQWLPGMFVAIPLVMLAYGCLAAVCTLAGVLFRSPLLAIMVTLMVWFGGWGAHMADEALAHFGARAVVRHTDAARALDIVRADADAAQKAFDADSDLKQAMREDDDLRIAAGVAIRGDIHPLELTVDERLENRRSLEKWGGRAALACACLPRTGEVVALIQRWLPEGAPASARRGRSPREEEVVEKAAAASWLRSSAGIVGGALAFQAAVLALACAVFKRRDF